MARYNTTMIDIENLTDLELLKTHCIYSSDFEDLTETKQVEIYRYCKLHFPRMPRKP